MKRDFIDFGYPGYRARENDDHTLTLVYEDTRRVCRDVDGHEIRLSRVERTRKSLREAAGKQDDYLRGLHETLTELYGDTVSGCVPDRGKSAGPDEYVRG